MPLQKRVDPFGNLIPTGARGTIMGNRGGVLHNANREIVRDYKSRRWITCVLEFRGRHRIVMSANRYTELFFLDEAVAFAAGHRPCAECRRVSRAEQKGTRREEQKGTSCGVPGAPGFALGAAAGAEPCEAVGRAVRAKRKPLPPDDGERPAIVSWCL
jgi:hypothetical protein